MGRSPCCDESGLKKGPWTAEEDQKLVNHIKKHGHSSWRALPKLAGLFYYFYIYITNLLLYGSYIAVNSSVEYIRYAGLNRCGKSCRLRWTNYLKPDIKRGKFSKEEEQTILHLHTILGNKWSAIATHLPGRTDNEIKNFWNTNLKKKLIQMGFDPMTHQPQTDLFSSLPHLIALATLKELVEQHSWEEQHAGRLPTEASLMATLQYLQYLLQPPLNPSTIFLSTFSNDIRINNNGMAETETFNILMNSIGSNNTPEMNIPMLDTTTFQSVGESIPFDHLPDLQVPNCNYQTPLSNKDDMSEKFDFNGLSHIENDSISTSSLFPSSSSISSAAIQGEGSSSNSDYEGAPDQSFWHELLLQHSMFFHDIA